MTLLLLPWILSGAESSPLVSHPQLAVTRPTFTRTSANSEEGENPQLVPSLEPGVGS